ncbi:hypothetical protein [Shewanella woodyi]|uniref:hypothetical protein n=1 Tax=Shewanella woodyi TaxID=60961 RepID=UPI0007F96C45|nr:hypothetical protein [Shewanella woodyi]
MNKANCHLMSNLTKALQCAATLDKNGVTIKSVTLTGRKPCIEVENNKRLEQLPAVPVAVSSQCGYRLERLSAEINGTDVQWNQPIFN